MKKIFLKFFVALQIIWRDAGVVERGSLENCCTLYVYQGFESLSLRQIKSHK